MPIAPQASNVAGDVDSVFLFILALSVAFLVLITALIIYFAIKYNRKKHPKGEDIEGHTWLEIVWTAIPTVLFLAMFVFGWTNYNYMREVPREAMVIEATGRQWAWSLKNRISARKTSGALWRPGQRLLSHRPRRARG
jgi:cytochrome c oxidase subunit 2